MKFQALVAFFSVIYKNASLNIYFFLEYIYENKTVFLKQTEFFEILNLNLANFDGLEYKYKNRTVPFKTKWNYLEFQTLTATFSATYKCYLQKCSFHFLANFDLEYVYENRLSLLKQK